MKGNFVSKKVMLFSSFCQNLTELIFDNTYTLIINKSAQMLCSDLVYIFGFTTPPLARKS